MNTTNWEVWAYGKKVSDMSDDEIRIRADRAWLTNDGDELRRFRAAAALRNIQVI